MMTAQAIGEMLVNFCFIILGVLAFFALWSWLESKDLWNDGTCQNNGLPWQVFAHSDGFIELRAGDVRRRVSGILVYGPIVDRLRRFA